MADSVFKNVDSAAPIEVFRVTKLFNECQDLNKVNLGVGAYRNEEGKPWVLPVVHTTELQMANDKSLNHEYLPVAGLPDFRTAATKLLLGSSHKAIVENRAEGFQALGGTGALRLGAAFLKNVLKFDTAYVSAPTWENHKNIFRSAGFSQIKEYRYWNSETRGLNFSGFCEDLSNAPPNAVVILHAVAHNPTGIDPTQEQWEEIATICKEKKLFVFLDCAYQGFASGNLNDDGWASRFFADQDIDLFIAQSFSKNFGLYNERTGNLIVVTKDPLKLPEIRSQMEMQIRVIWSNPPNHGGRIVTTVLNNKAYFDDWKTQILIMAERIKKMRQELVDNLKKLGTPGTWDHIIRQIGMFSYTGLTEKQVEYMKSKNVFLLNSGRISMAGLNSKNVGYVAKTIDEAVRSHPSESRHFVEFARRKLTEVVYNVIKTAVVVDGELLVEGSVKEEDKDTESIKSFVKVTISGSFSSTSIMDIKIADKVESSQVQEEAEDVTPPPVQPEEMEEKDWGSTSSQVGTATTKTFKTRSIQTVKAAELEELYKPKSFPARFEGTMVTPVYFDGLMLTPEKLGELLKEATETDEAMSIPVKFQGGMLTAAFKNLAENLDFGSGNQPVPVKFHGRLQGVLDPSESDAGIPVAFDGEMIPKVKGKKA